MTFQPVNATAEAELVFSLAGQVCENTLFFRQDTTYNVSDLTDLSAALITWWVDNMQAELSTDITLTSVKCTSIEEPGGPQFINTATLPIAGAVPTGAAPNNVAACISLRTALIGRPFRGRNYIAGLPKTVITNSTISGTVLSNIATAYAALKVLPVTGRWVVVTRQVDHVIQMPAALTNFVTTAFFVNPFAKSQRRRTPGVGI
jgi:hypothetical protein